MVKKVTPLLDRLTDDIFSVDNLVQTQSNDDTPDVELMDDDLLLTPTVVFGFSLADKVWCTSASTLT